MIINPIVIAYSDVLVPIRRRYVDGRPLPGDPNADPDKVAVARFTGADHQNICVGREAASVK
jgi:hypothetical protein